MPRPYITSNEIFEIKLCESRVTDFMDKDRRIEEITNRDLARFNEIFKITGGCETIDNERMNIQLMRNGFGAVSVHDDKLYFLMGNLGKELTPQYVPTHFVFSNPWIGESGWDGDLVIGEQCAVLRNDSQYQGLLPILDKYNTLIAETELSLYDTLITTRGQYAFTAGSDNDVLAFEKWIEKLIEGKISAISAKDIVHKVATLPFSNQTQAITDLIEALQYWTAKKFNEMGLDSNFNMKRESLNATEARQNSDSLHPWIDNMLETRQKDFDKANEMFGEYLTEPWKVELSSTWKYNEEAEAAALKVIKKQSEREDDEPDPISIQRLSEPEENKGGTQND